MKIITDFGMYVDSDIFVTAALFCESQAIELSSLYCLLETENPQRLADHEMFYKCSEAQYHQQTVL